jgi:hypothetical protein
MAPTGIGRQPFTSVKVRWIFADRIWITGANRHYDVVRIIHPFAVCSATDSAKGPHTILRHAACSVSKMHMVGIKRASRSH